MAEQVAGKNANGRRKGASLVARFISKAGILRRDKFRNSLSDAGKLNRERAGTKTGTLSLSLPPCNFFSPREESSLDEISPRNSRAFDDEDFQKGETIRDEVDVSNWSK